ncbi:NAD(P)-dependent dehydrogenase, short-chain alcohol dehydrogenase family [Modicisalibacter muralis]|uniref:NAD(P)-dependent dehydrogenase, short-chain alcohol dehydrogenase family n=1 Tax=Modicisalibacter muralis TaxID=119000 RepID=A0A1G9LKU9_9GAMM|nr:SDR family oxidoreductase [Halomonas muralis]SDL62473.1 NAD(P)-dependent dehydrogenase, short-chain alcohol dehydrogenase family [Halomonas muralis]
MLGCENIFDISGRTILVVGAGGGIGTAVTKGLVAHGARVIAADNDEQSLAKLGKEIDTCEVNITTRFVDATDLASIQMLADEFKDIDVLVILPAILVRKALVDQTEEDFNKQVNINIKSHFYVAKVFSTLMAQKGGGSIIAFSSIRSITVEPMASVYSATKAAVRQLMRSLASEVGSRGVRVNLIAPSSVETRMTADLQDDGLRYKETANRAMLKRWARPADIVGPVIFLASEASGFITGAEIFVDGGWTASDGMKRV